MTKYLSLSSSSIAKNIFICQFFIVAFTALLAVSASAQTSTSAMNNFVSELMKKMTLEEKIG
jgi:hypothetical protein